LTDIKPSTDAKNVATETRVQDEGFTLARTKIPRGTIEIKRLTIGIRLKCFGSATTTANRRNTAITELTNLIVRIELETSALANQLITQ
jgi:hypothetical protein